MGGLIFGATLFAVALSLVICWLIHTKDQRYKKRFEHVCLIHDLYVEALLKMESDVDSLATLGPEVAFAVKTHIRDLQKAVRKVRKKHGFEV